MREIFALRHGVCCHGYRRVDLTIARACMSEMMMELERAVTGGSGINLELLSKDLSLSAAHESPEEYIRRTLVAHGFFSRRGKATEAEKDDSKGRKNQVCISEEDKKRTTQLVFHYKEGKEVPSLKEPRGLFGGVRLKSQDDLPLWPAEVECLPIFSKFIYDPPPFREPFYKPDSEVLAPKIRSTSNIGEVVYYNHHGASKYLTKLRAGPSPNAKLHVPKDSCSLIFESRFESGNLLKAVQVGRWDYELFLHPDLYTRKHTQWFFFSVRNMRAGQTYRFTIVNFYKADSLHNSGMQPVMHSEVDAERRGIGWRRAGHAIRYFKTSIRRGEAFHYGLTWSHTFEHASDTCYFAHCYPYTYSDLKSHLAQVQADPAKASFCKQRTLCHTLAGNPVPLLTITSPAPSLDGNIKCRRAVVVTSRVHPGETNGSWMMKGLLDFLTGNSPDAKVLRDMFVFKVVPMLNPDGVIVGNYRCSLAGRDLNRNYGTELEGSYPTVWHTIAMVKRLREEREVVLYCDLHGHSRKQNVFVYGCDNDSDPHKRFLARVFPKMLSKNAPSKFSYKSSKFAVQKSKEGTGRVHMWKELGVVNSYTMEATFCGSVLGRLSGMQFNTGDLQSMGFHLCDTLLDYCDPSCTKVERVLEEIRDDVRRQVVSRLQALGRPLPFGVDPLDLASDPDIMQALDSSDAGSDSSVSDGPPVGLTAAKGGDRKKKKRLKSRKERNRKVLFKMTHKQIPAPPPPAPSHAPSNPLPPVESSPLTSTLPKSTPTRKVLPVATVLSSSDLVRGGSGGGATGVGVPVFVQERMEEKQKRRESESCVGLARPEQESHVETVAMEYLRQVGVAESRDLPPMSISALSVAEGQRQHPRVLPLARTPAPTTTPAPRAYCSEVCNEIPHSDAVTVQGKKQQPSAAFASNYVTHHLRELLSSPSGACLRAGGLAASSKLANLSRLFRQLGPQAPGPPTHTSTHTTSPPVHHSQSFSCGDHGNQPATPPIPMLQQSSSSQFHKRRKKARAGVGHCTANGTVAPPPRGGVAAPSDPVVERCSSDNSVSLASSLSKLTEQDKKLLADIRSSYSSITKDNPLGNNWQGFPLNAQSGLHVISRESRGEGRVGVASPDLLELKQPPTVSLGHSLPPSSSLSPSPPPICASSPLGKPPSPSMPRPASPSSPSPNPTGTGVPLTPSTYTFESLPHLSSPLASDAALSASVAVHKQKVADAVEGIHQQQRRDKRRRHRPLPSLQGSAGPRPPPPTAPPQQQEGGEGEGAVSEGWRRVRCERRGFDETRPLLPARDSTVVARVLSSRGASSRPHRQAALQEGVMPAKVSLRLNGSTRPHTMQGPRQPRPLHIRYFTKKALS